MNNSAYNLKYRLSQGNMHIALSGEFNTNLVQNCIDCVSTSYEQGGRIFLDTRNIDSFCDKATEEFKNFFTKVSFLATSLYLKGEKGFKILPEGGKLLIMHTDKEDSSCACGGKCGGENAKADAHGKQKCKVCKCSLAKKRAMQKAANE